jgi:hypothetical protein
MDVEYPPLFSPQETTHMVITIDPHQDYFVGGELSLECQDGTSVTIAQDGHLLQYLSRIEACKQQNTLPNVLMNDKYESNRMSFFVPKSETSQIQLEIAIVTGEPIEEQVKLMVELRYNYCDPCKTETIFYANKRKEANVRIAPILHQKSIILKQIGRRMFAQIQLQSNPWVGVVLYPKDCEFWASKKTGLLNDEWTNLLIADSAHPQLKVRNIQICQKIASGYLSMHSM